MLPPWVKVLPYLLGFVMFILVSTQFLGDNSFSVSDETRARLEADQAQVIAGLGDVADLVEGAAQGTTPTTLVSPTETAPTPASDSNTASTTPPATLSGEPTVTLQFKNGGTAPVPESALAAARSATVALFTGVFDGVALGQGVKPPVLERTWKDPYVGDPVLAAVGDGVFSVVFRVDPDRSGPATLREITTSVELVPGRGWAWLGV